MQAQPDYGPALCVLGLIDAALGRKEEALREGRRAIELLPVEKDSTQWQSDACLFRDHRCLGGREGHCFAILGGQRSIARRIQVATYGALKLLPFWDPLRGDPRFEKIVRFARPKVDSFVTNHCVAFAKAGRLARPKDQRTARERGVQTHRKNSQLS